MKLIVYTLIPKSDKGTQFAGTSAVLNLQEGSGSPNVVGVMSRHQEGVRVWTIE